MEDKKLKNMTLYEYWRKCPDNALKTIKGGKLAGKSDINPVWRIKVLTEQFGPCGEGWYIEEVERWTSTTGTGEATEVGAYVKVHLFYKTSSGEWSKPVVGVGGNKLVGKGVGTEQNDEAWKMAMTDAMSVACKNLGIAADVYFASDRTKYDLQSENAEQTGGNTSGGRKPVTGQNTRQTKKVLVTLQAVQTGAHSKEIVWLSQYNPADREQYTKARNDLWAAFDWESQEAFLELERMAAKLRQTQQTQQTQNS